LTSGTTDYDYILNDILSWPYQIKACYYDSYNSTQFVISATSNGGIEMIPYSQQVSAFNRPTKEQERLLKSGKIRMNKNPLNLFCYRNVVLRSDYVGNVKPDKKDQNKKVDGVIAQLMSMAGYLLEPIAPMVY
jgi:phage terminase large subunit-like protein